VLWAAVLGSPLLFLVLLQTNYVLAYPSCAARSNAWILVSSAIGFALVLLLTLGASHVWRTDPQQQREGPAGLSEQRNPIGEDLSMAARHFLSVLGLLLSGLTVLLVIGLAIPPLLLRPCD
jgi:hypothetical protein